MARVKPGQLDGGGLRALQPKPTGDLGKTESPVDGSGSHRLCGELKEAKRVKPSRNRESNQEVGFTNQFTRGGPGKTEPPSPESETGSQSFTRQSKRGRHGQTESPSFFCPCPLQLSRRLARASKGRLPLRPAAFLQPIHHPRFIGLFSTAYVVHNSFERLAPVAPGFFQIVLDKASTDLLLFSCKEVRLES